MAVYTASLGDGRTVRIDIPDRIDLYQPATNADARAVIASTLADYLRPHLSARPPSKQIVRDSAGQIVRLVEVAGATGDELANEVARQIARHIVPEDAG